MFFYVRSNYINSGVFCEQAEGKVDLNELEYVLILPLFSDVSAALVIRYCISSCKVTVIKPNEYIGFYRNINDRRYNQELT